MTLRLGIDLGGTKIEIIALDEAGTEMQRRRVPTPQSGYDDTIRIIRNLVTTTESALGRSGSVGIAIPGAISPVTGLVKNANSTRLIGHALDQDLAAALNRPIRVANDANCFALSEAVDGAGKGCDVVFGIIAGTGVGGGVCFGGRVRTGPHAIAGEWGHNPLPSPTADEQVHAPRCYCGKRGCIESWCSGPAIAAEFHRVTGRKLSAPDIAASGDAACRTAMERFFDRFARAVATLVNVLDPDAIVLGGGLSNIEALYTELPRRVQAYAFTPEGPSRLLRNTHGDSSGVRGAAWLWPQADVAQGLPK